MLAFLVVTIIILASFGLIHWYWNRKRDEQDALDAQSKFYFLFFRISYSERVELLT
jgi:hypothetical protein